MIEEEDKIMNKQLALIHKEYDKIKSINRKKQVLIQKMQNDIHAIKRSNNSMTEDKYTLDIKVQKLENYLDSIVNKRREEENYMKSYQYLLDRIKEDRHALDKELRRQQTELSQKKYSLNTELTKSKKLHEKTVREKIQIRTLSDDISKERKAQEDTLALIEKKAMERSKAVAQLEESNKNRELITEHAQGQISNVETIHMRQKLLLLQFWYSFLNKKLQIELEKGGILEAPFQKIRITTGMQTVEDILTRFLTREETYKDLIRAVKASEKKLNQLKNDLNQATQQLSLLKIRESDEPIIPQEDLIRIEKRSYANYKEMSKKYQHLIQNLKEWAKKQLLSMSSNMDSENINELMVKVLEQSEKVMGIVKKKVQINTGVLENVMFMPTKSLVKQGVFSKHFENNCHVMPRKGSLSDEDARLLIGN
ncbi:hypothetical protein SteCoe_25785 [Stentor coeruleus]|uniref:Uncharacterized protein n=1 Tax=Stentor coeruleus TaxID=5963 RepID=A0A1R2BEC2_9CILI|nr:hypothetical protein SteCoe_25785 [Stentor coeruleus]